MVKYYRLEVNDRSIRDFNEHVQGVKHGVFAYRRVMDIYSLNMPVPEEDGIPDHVISKLRGNYIHGCSSMQQLSAWFPLAKLQKDFDQIKDDIILAMYTFRDINDADVYYGNTQVVFRPVNCVRTEYNLYELVEMLMSTETGFEKVA